jgi:hypothetical protein
MGHSQELLRLRVAGIVFSFLRGTRAREVAVDEISRLFLTREHPDVRIRVHWGIAPRPHPSTKVLRNDHAELILEPDSSDVDMYVALPDALQEVFLVQRLHAFLDLTVLTYLLGLRRAVPIHACGIHDNGRGFLFTGASDSGKTTLANLWKDRPGVTVLSDERLFLRRKETGYWMYGSLLRSGPLLPSPQGARVDRVFFIAHADSNAASLRGATESAVDLLRRAFPYWYYYMDEQYPLDFCVELSQEVPCADLGFVPGDGIVDYVRGLK